MLTTSMVRIVTQATLHNKFGFASSLGKRLTPTCYRLLRLLADCSDKLYKMATTQALPDPDSDCVWNKLAPTCFGGSIEQDVIPDSEKISNKDVQLNQDSTPTLMAIAQDMTSINQEPPLTPPIVTVTAQTEDEPMEDYLLASSFL